MESEVERKEGRHAGAPVIQRMTRRIERLVHALARISGIASARCAEDLEKIEAIADEALAAGIESEEPEQATAPHVADTFAVRDVIAERRRQIEAEGWTPEHDDRHNAGEMALAASCYAQEGPDPYGYGWPTIPSAWPWSPDWWKPQGYRRNLVKAAALILAEIERLDRLVAKKQEGK